jgi:hypothetical protein
MIRQIALGWLIAGCHDRLRLRRRCNVWNSPTDALAETLKKGAENLIEGAPATGREFVQRAYQRALGRNPTQQELGIAEEMVCTPVRREGIEDLLWAIAMLPEFQLIL